MTKRSDRTRGTRPDFMGNRLKAMAIKPESNKTRGKADALSGARPVFTLQPSDTTVPEFTTAVFLCEATDPLGGTLAYQWQQLVQGVWVDLTDGVEGVAGAQSQGLNINLVDFDVWDGERVRCAATNSVATVYSNSAELTVETESIRMVSEAGTYLVDEPATANIIDERSTGP